MTHFRTEMINSIDHFSAGEYSTKSDHLTSDPMSNDRIKSIIPRKPAMTNTATTTTPVDPMTSLRLGQVTFLVSAWTSCRKLVTCSTYSRMTKCSQIKTRRSGSHRRVLGAGQEGFEPPTPGFGVRCSSRSSYWPVLQP